MSYSPAFPFSILMACFLVLALIIYTLTPALRRPLQRLGQKKIDELDRQREAEIAQLIANGEAVLIKASKKSFKYWCAERIHILPLVFLFVFPFYINETAENCTSLWGLNGQFILAMFYMVGMTLLSMMLIITKIKSYQEAIRDGYSPPRTAKYYRVDTVCFKLTPIIRRRLKIGNIMVVLMCILFICFPIILCITSKHPTIQDITSLSRLNGLYQTVCLDRLQSSRVLK